MLRYYQYAKPFFNKYDILIVGYCEACESEVSIAEADEGGHYCPVLTVPDILGQDI